MVSKKSNYLNKIADKATNSQLEIIKQLTDKLISEIENISQKQSVIFDEKFNLEEQVEEFEANLIRHALLVSNGNQRRAAQMLGANPSTLNNKIKRYGIGEIQALAKYDRG